MKVVIIEDERLTAEDLYDTLMEIDSTMNVTAILGTVKEAVQYFKSHMHPDLIFSDIQLGDGLSFDIFNQVDISSPIIFCTAYNEYALNAFKTTGIHYILKPFDREAIREALLKYEKLQSTLFKNPEWFKDVQGYFISENKPNVSSILVYFRDKIIPVKIDDIALFYIENGLTFMLSYSNDKYVVDDRLSELEKKVGMKFFRANRQHLVNKNAIIGISERHSRKAEVNLNVQYDEMILLSKEKIIQFLKWLES